MRRLTAAVAAVAVIVGLVFLITGDGGSGAEDDDGINLLVTSPDNGAIVDGPTTEFTYALSADRDLIHTLVINGEEYRHNEIEAGATSIFREDVTLPDAGQHMWTLRLQDPETKDIVREYDMRTVTINQSQEDIGVDLRQPSNGSVVEGSTPVFEYSVTAPFAFTADLFVDGQLVDSTRFGLGEHDYQVSHVIDEAGEHEWSLQILSTDRVVHEAGPQGFETTSAPSPVEMREIGMVQGIDSVEVGETVQMTASAAVRQQMDYRLILDGEVYKEGQVTDGRLWLYESYTTQEAGNHTWYVELDNGDETFESDTVTFEAR